MVQLAFKKQLGAGTFLTFSVRLLQQFFENERLRNLVTLQLPYSIE